MKHNHRVANIYTSYNTNANKKKQRNVYHHLRPLWLSWLSHIPNIKQYHFSEAKGLQNGEVHTLPPPSPTSHPSPPPPPAPIVAGRPGFAWLSALAKACPTRVRSAPFLVGTWLSSLSSMTKQDKACAFLFVFLCRVCLFQRSSVCSGRSQRACVDGYKKIRTGPRAAAVQEGLLTIPQEKKKKKKKTNTKENTCLLSHTIRTDTERVSFVL